MPISSQKWAQYKSIVNNFAKTANKAILIWVRGIDRVEQFREEEHESGDRVNLDCLIGYNSFRTWPITKQDQSGELDNQNMLVFLNKQYLRDLGYLTANNYFNFKPDKDYFIYQGIKYKCEGDTAVSHAHDDDLHITLILHREETLTGDDRFAYPTGQAVIQEIETDKAYILSYDL
jgi:hypothetical protein